MELPSFDPSEVHRTLSLVVEDGGVYETRVLDARLDRAWRTGIVSGYFDDHEACIVQLGRLTNFSGIYITLNPVIRALLARRANRLDYALSSALTGDQHIAKRRWLLIDIDPVRPSGVSSTDQEKEAAWKRTEMVMDYLAKRGWPEPVIADSGNGFHLLLRINLPVNDNSVVQRLLRALADQFDDDVVKIDRDVFNPSRISRLYGTLTAKGDSIPERQHRLGKIITQTGAD
jgi:hypothetical protein